MTRNQSYPGNELQLFAEAFHWKNYFSDLIQPFLGDCVLEVGAGIGGTTAYLNMGTATEWICLEPDRELLSELETSLEAGLLKQNVRCFNGLITDIDPEKKFDSIIYIDVLEHIEDDHAEVRVAASLLKPGGYLIVLSPAHQWLFSPFDRAIGHCRRYSMESLRKLTPETMTIERLWFLDSLGLSASLWNRAILRKDIPSLRQVKLWDQYLVRCSRWIDPLLRHCIGRSLLAIWRYTEE